MSKFTVPPHPGYGEPQAPTKDDRLKEAAEKLDENLPGEERRRPPSSAMVSPQYLPQRPFVLGPGQAHVVDGDTLHVKWYPRDHMIAIRMAAVNAPEKAPRGDIPSEDGWKSLKPGQARGLYSKVVLSELIEERSILIIPARTGRGEVHDPYGRLTAHIFASGPSADGFVLTGAVDLEREMMALGHARQMQGKHLFQMNLHDYVDRWLQAGHDFRPISAAIIPGNISITQLEGAGPDKTPAVSKLLKQGVSLTEVRKTVLGEEPHWASVDFGR